MNQSLVEETVNKARPILNRALKFGVDVGRLRLGKPGKKAVSQRYFLAKVTQRRQANIKYNRNKKLVDFVNTEPKPPAKKSQKNPLGHISIPGISITRVTSSGPSSMTQPMLTPADTKNYGRGLRQGLKKSLQTAQLKHRPILPKPSLVTLDSDSDDDEIEVISEKINPTLNRPQLKIVKVRSQPQALVIPVRAGVSSKLSSEKKKTVKVQPAVKRTEEEARDPFAEDEDLTCRVCHSAFWFRSQIVEHLQSKHHVKDPETFLREKRRKV